MDGIFTQGIVDDLSFLNELSFVGLCTVFPFIVVTDSEGAEKETFNTPIPNVPCRLDDLVNDLIPQRSRDGINVDKIERTLYIPRTITIHTQDEIETSEGQPDNSVVRYRVMNVVQETQQTDIALTIEEKY